MLLVCRDDLRRLPDQRDVLLVVEVALSSLRDDRGRKLAAYTRTGVERFADLDGGRPRRSTICNVGRRSHRARFQTM